MENSHHLTKKMSSSGELHVPVPVAFFAFTPTLPAVLDVAQPPPPPENSFPTPTELLQDIAAHDQHASRQKKRVKRRRATQEAVARGLGYMPTDPDSLSSHDKKRLYLDCLEQYVDWLHGDMGVSGFQPVPIERVSSGRGLTSRSIRVGLCCDCSAFVCDRSLIIRRVDAARTPPDTGVRSTYPAPGDGGSAIRYARLLQQPARAWRRLRGRLSLLWNHF